MERERINSEKKSRIIQQKNNLCEVYMVDNRSDKNQNYLSDSTLQQISYNVEDSLQGKNNTSVQRVEDEDDTLQGKFYASIQKKNETGMPDNLKVGIESLSRFSMDDVRVHYNSSKPPTFQALAYTQGTDIHVAPKQEKHPYEAWHVAQQMAGRISPTTIINGLPVNDNVALEKEADMMEEEATLCVNNYGKNQKDNDDLIGCCQPLQLLPYIDIFNKPGAVNTVGALISLLEGGTAKSIAGEKKYHDNKKIIMEQYNKIIKISPSVVNVNIANALDFKSVLDALSNYKKESTYVNDYRKYLKEFVKDVFDNSRIECSETDIGHCVDYVLNDLDTGGGTDLKYEGNTVSHISQGKIGRGSGCSLLFVRKPERKIVAIGYHVGPKSYEYIYTEKGIPDRLSLK